MPDVPPKEKFDSILTEPEGAFHSYSDLSTLGIRQQYLIGQELRRRFVKEEKFLNESYMVGETYMRTAGNA